MSNLTLNHTYETLLALLRCALHGQEESPKVVDFSAVIREARLKSTLLPSNASN